MKTIKTGILMLILSLSFTNTYGQQEIFGQWKVSCFLERNPNGSLAICGLCPTSIMDGHSLQIKDFELELDEQLVQITINGKTTGVKYTWDRSIDAISFAHEKTQYTFKVLRSSSPVNYIWKDNNCGGVFLLTRK